MGRSMGADTLAAESTSTWSETVTSPVIGFVVGLVAIGGIIAESTLLGDSSQSFSATIVSLIVLCVVLLLMLTFVRVRVSVDQRGLRVRSWLFGIRLTQVSLDQVELAFADTVSALRLGGWGYRVASGRTAVVMRGGPWFGAHLRQLGP
ncbi:hypothetical protein [Cryobacterium sp. PH29-G1]|uniref:hypothetical protein n=1 Tax=Cryobacterium sp. PH29-G1 TaxID=3046211 RepID=UPI0024BA2477|nr:hypothetical protein [Cryobacterium sp. PH29-G1]MDJ0350471.1 hypothetical protein [Cryobacterium sp. PH29-G1]